MADNWYAQRDGRQVGPMPREKLAAALEGGRMSLDDLVWREGWPQWRPAGDVAELAAVDAAEVVEADAGADVDAGEYGVADDAPAVTAAVPARTAAPAARSLAYSSGRNTGDVTASPVALAALRSTRAWVMLFSILIFIGVGFGALMVLLFIGGALFGGGRGGAVAALASLIPIAGLLLYFFPALFLLRYGNAIGRLNVSRSPEDLEAALVSQKSFWKFLGFVFLVMIGLQLLGLLLLLVVGGIAASNTGGGFTAPSPPPQPSPGFVTPR